MDEHITCLPRYQIESPDKSWASQLPLPHCEMGTAKACFRIAGVIDPGMQAPPATASAPVSVVISSRAFLNQKERELKQEKPK